MVKSKLSPLIGFAALKQLKPIHKRGHKAFFLVTLFRVGFFIRSLPYGSYFSPTWNFGSLLGLSWVPVFSQGPLLVLDYRWSHIPPTYRRTDTPNWYRTYNVPKFGLQSSWITGECYYTRPFHELPGKKLMQLKVRDLTLNNSIFAYL